MCAAAAAPPPPPPPTPPPPPAAAHPSDWPSALAAAAAAEAAVVAAVTALGEPAFPIHAEPVEGTAILSRSSFVAPTVSRCSVPPPPPPSIPIACIPLPQRVDQSASSSAAFKGSLISFGITRCSDITPPVRVPLFSSLHFSDPSHLPHSTAFVGGRVTCKAWLPFSAAGHVGSLLAISASASRALPFGEQASGRACVQLWRFNQITAKCFVVALIPTAAAEVLSLAWCPRSFLESTFPSPVSYPKPEPHHDHSSPPPRCFLLAAALSSGQVEVWSVSSHLIATRYASADDRASADDFEAWATLRPASLMSRSFGSVCTSLVWSTCGRMSVERAVLLAGFSDGAIRTFSLLCSLCDDSSDVRNNNNNGDVSLINSLALPSSTYFLHAATFLHPFRHEPIAFTAARRTSDGSVVVAALGFMGTRSLFCSSLPQLHELQPVHVGQTLQDNLYPSAMMWPYFTGKVMLVADCESSSVEEIDAFTGHPRHTVFSLPDKQWPVDIALSPIDFFRTPEPRLSLVVAGSDGGVYLAPLFPSSVPRNYNQFKKQRRKTNPTCDALMLIMRGYRDRVTLSSSSDMCPAGHDCPFARGTHGSSSSSISSSISSSSSDSGGDYSGGGGGAAPSAPACRAGDACLGREWPLSQPPPPVFEARFADKLCVEASRDCFDTVHVPHKMELVHYEACSGVTMLAIAGNVLVAFYDCGFMCSIAMPRFKK